MQIKKLILALFVIFSLSFSYQPVSIYSKEKEVIVYIMSKDQDNYTADFINKNEFRKFVILISLTFQLMIACGNAVTYNTS